VSQFLMQLKLNFLVDKKEFNKYLFLDFKFVNLDESMSEKNKQNIKGRGAQIQTKNKFEKNHYDYDSFYTDINLDDTEHGVKTTYTEIFPKYL